MAGASAEEILAVWERGAAQSWTGRGVTLMAAWPPPQQAGNCAALSIGTRDGWLWQLRTQLFGHRLPCFAECPDCAEPLQFELDARQFSRWSTGSEPVPHEFDIGDFHLRCRALTSADLLDAQRLGDGAAVREALIARAIVEVRHGGAAAAISELNQEAIDAVGERLAAVDGAELLLDLNCAVCGHAWREPFDILAYLWSELGRYAKRLLREVHTLAWAYGWSEAEILALSPARRRVYLEWVS